jgi:F-type H+-transporting ATPase subunit c
MTTTIAKNTRTKQYFGGRTTHVCGGHWEQLKTKQQKDKIMFAVITGSLHVGLAALGSAVGVGLVGMKAAEATGRNPGAAGEIRTQAIIFAALAEGIVFIAIFLAK